jgi:excisionase family DNA binding protein
VESFVKKLTTSVAAGGVLTPRLLGVKATAAYLGASIWAVRTLAWSRAVPSLKIGNRVLFDRTDLDAYIEQQKVPAA